MIINKVSYKNEIMEVHYSVLKEGGKEDYYTIRSGDQPLPKFRNLLLKMRTSLLDLLELPTTDDEVKKVVVNQIAFDYTGEKNVLGAVISGKRTLEHSAGSMPLKSPHKFATAAKADTKAVFDKKLVDTLMEIQDECEKYVNGERSQGELFKDAKVEVTITAEGIKPEKKAKKSKENKFQEKLEEAKKDAPKSKKKFNFNFTGPEAFAIKAKGKYLSISANSALKLTALISEDGVLQDSIHDEMKEVGYAGHKILFEIDGGLLQIHSAVSDYKQINNDNLAKNVIEELIQDFVDQPILRLKPSPEALKLVTSGQTAHA